MAVVGSLMSLAPPAGAFVLNNGTCALDLTVTFGASDALTNTSPAPYYIRANSGSCGFLPDGEPVGFAFANGAAGEPDGNTLARCGVLAGVGSWNQGFDNGTFLGTHVLSGTWLDATMLVTTVKVSASPTVPPFHGVIHLAPYNLNEALSQIQTCATGGNVPSIHMIGTEVWNDPSAP